MAARRIGSATARIDCACRPWAIGCAPPSPASRVVTLSMKPRSTVMLAGHGGTAVTWFGDSNVWATSTAYATAPVPAVAALRRRQSRRARSRRGVGARPRAPATTPGEDEKRVRAAAAGLVVALSASAGRRRAAPAERVLRPVGAQPVTPTRIWARWRQRWSEPFSSGSATSSIISASASRGSTTSGHDFGPDSHEVQDTLIRLDRTLGEFFGDLDKLVGRDRYVVGLSADHGVARIPEAQTARRASMPAASSTPRSARSPKRRWWPPTGPGRTSRSWNTRTSI